MSNNVYGIVFLIMADNQIKISLVSVSEVPGATALNRSALRRMGQQPVSVDINAKVVPDMQRNMLSLVVSCSYIAVAGISRQRVLTCSVVATYEVEKLQEYISKNNGNIVVATPLLHRMLSITVGSLRGVIAVRTAGTPLRHRPLPIIDLDALMYRINFGQN